jgi:hypothetical protein
MTSTARSDSAPPSRTKRRPSIAPVPEPPAESERVVDEDEDDASQGEWLFKENDLVLGPVTAAVLVERIKNGELSADTPIARDGQPFRSMKLVRLFRDAWLLTEEEKRLAAEERAYQAAVRRAAVLRVVVVLLAFAVPFAAAGVGARVVFIKRPWDDTATMLARVPPLIDLPQKPPEVKVAQKAPDPRTAPPDDADDADDDDDGRASDPKRPRRPKRPGTSPTNVQKTGDTVTAPPPKPDDGMVQQGLTNAQAVAPLNSIKDALKACFKAELDSNPDMPSSVTLSYTVTEEGKAINIDLEQRELRGRPVVGCVRKAVGGLKWPRFSGERKNISVPFKFSKPKPPK